MNNFFINITKDLALKKDNSCNINTLEDVLKVFNTHPSVERNIEINEKFSFQQATEDLVRKIVLNLHSSKVFPVGEMPVDMLRSTVDIHLPFITKIKYLSFENNCFPDDLKLAEVSPVFKKNNDLNKEIPRPVSVLSLVSKVFERIVYNQIDNFMKDKLSNLLTGFRKNHGTQH